ncbi:MAG TPA: type III pantothenate kinase [candidate division Zixibacteria bacterium]|nr:type III pantothenate kinase [candidate division Zixibacteria bacterium]
MAILAIDIGNRRAKLAIVSVEDEIVHRLHFPTAEISANADRIKNIANDSRLAGIAIGSSVPSATQELRRILEDYKSLIVTGDTPTQLSVEYEPKSELGADRLSAAVGAFHVYGKALKRNILVVDAGTAVTADLVSEGGVFLGGAIFPGDIIAFSSLAENTALLKNIEFRPVDTLIGMCTEDCMLVGVRAAIVGTIEHLYKRYGDIHGEHPFMLLTGASAAWIAPELSVPHMVDPDIVLIGLSAIWTFNHGNSVNVKTPRTV